jgi:hypothetical protein
MQQLHSPAHQVVQAWLEDAALRLCTADLKALAGHFTEACRAETKLFHTFESAFRREGPRGDRREFATAQQRLQVFKPVLRMIRAYRSQLQVKGAVANPQALAAFVLSKALQEAPQALLKPVDRDTEHLTYQTAKAVTSHQKQLARDIISATPSLFPPLPSIDGKLPSEYDLRAREHRRKIVEARTKIIDKVRDAGILNADELTVLYGMI